ncbi:hypothetical protein BKA62DRAFT_419999 [Auriculariales sp. MPI-PUGE-AT-0066]|nr:hypothetical protein BKA62DRAFT_419999 [Auriculariales sp. MPI-PUGE-AT-0066]
MVPGRDLHYSFQTPHETVTRRRWTTAQFASFRSISHQLHLLQFVLCTGCGATSRQPGPSTICSFAFGRGWLGDFGLNPRIIGPKLTCLVLHIFFFLIRTSARCHVPDASCCLRVFHMHPTAMNPARQTLAARSFLFLVYGVNRGSTTGADHRPSFRQEGPCMHTASPVAERALALQTTTKAMRETHSIFRAHAFLNRYSGAPPALTINPRCAGFVWRRLIS